MKRGMPVEDQTADKVVESMIVTSLASTPPIETEALNDYSVVGKSEPVNVIKWSLSDRVASETLTEEV